MRKLAEGGGEAAAEGGHTVMWDLPGWMVGRRGGEGVFSAANLHLKTNRRFPFLNLEELQRGHVTGRRRRRGLRYH